MFRASAIQLGLTATNKQHTSSTNDKTVVKYSDNREIPANIIIRLGRLIENIYLFNTEVNQLPYWTKLFASKQAKIKSSTTAI